MHLLLLFETSHAHFKKLVQIRADDAKELQSLEQRVRFIRRLVKDALIEFQPTQLTVDEMGAILKLHARIVRPRTARSRGDFCDSSALSFEIAVAKRAATARLVVG
jgi:hypothetical protein